MKKKLIVIALIFSATIMFAQNDRDYLEVTREVLKTEKKA